MSNNNYPKRFEILQNDGKTLKISVGELAKGLGHYYARHSINDIYHDDTKKISIPETLVYPIEKSGKHTFSFYEYNPDEKFDALSDGIDLYEDNDPIWEQDVFVIKTIQTDLVSILCCLCSV